MAEKSDKISIKGVFRTAIIVLAMFAVLEAAIRIIEPAQSEDERFYQDVFAPYTTFKPGVDNPYNEVAEFLNDNGFRGPDFDRQKPKDIYRIICIGDSRTFGMEMPYEDSYPAQLERLLNSHGGGRRYEVINAGIPGTNIFQQRLMFDEVFTEVEADMLLLMADPNFRPELADYRRMMDNTGFKISYSLRKTMTHFATYRLMRRLIKGGQNDAALDDHQIREKGDIDIAGYLEEYRKDLNWFSSVCKKRGMKFGIISIADRAEMEKYIENLLALLKKDHGLTDMVDSQVEEPKPALSELARANKVSWDFTKKSGDLNFYPMIPPMNDYGNIDKYWQDSQHPTALGSKALADSLVFQFKEYGILKSK